jgi:hypothetical protein
MFPVPSHRQGKFRSNNLHPEKAMEQYLKLVEKFA